MRLRMRERYNNKMFRGYNHLMLIGPPSCGKTTVGKVLSDFLRRKFLDIGDDVVKDQLNGLKYDQFVQEESKLVLDALPKLPVNTIISMSGSNPLDQESFQEMRKGNLVVWLDECTWTLHKPERVPEFDGDMRQLYRNRRPFYEANHDIRVAAYYYPPIRVAAHVVETIYQFNDYS